MRYAWARAGWILFTSPAHCRFGRQPFLFRAYLAGIGQDGNRRA